MRPKRRRRHWTFGRDPALRLKGVPLEGQWERQNSPLRGASRREGRALAIVASAFVLAIAVVAYAALQHDSGGRGAGCVNITTPSTTGGASLHACGRAAAGWCRSEAARGDAFARVVQASCRRAGYR